MEREFPRRLLLQWHLSERCNLRCSHCYQDTYERKARGLEDWQMLLRDYTAFLKLRPGMRGHINLTGGEPLALPEFPALMEMLVRMPDAIPVGILSNGTLIDDAMARNFRNWRVHHVQVSLDGNRATHDAIRGAGAFEAAVRGLRALKTAGVKSVVSFTAQRSNWREFSDIAALGAELGVWRVWADRLIPFGQAERDEVMTPEETKEFFALMAAASVPRQMHFLNKSGNGVAMHRALQFLMSNFSTNNTTPYHCTAGDTLITVMPDGALYPCRRLPITVGNVYETPLETLYDCALFRRLRSKDWICSGCEACLYHMICRGGLRCLAYAMTGRIDTADPGCWLAKQTGSTASPTAAAATAAATTIASITSAATSTTASAP
ncbi:MAG: radical SAM protein [Azoarcus sp.]|jgi:radical SAM protein with 4Fe4S-binding SPASM domain|nr:radical SAM protein [Azoarcus sp.]